MRPAAKPGFWLVARREWRWLLHDRAAVILIFGVPLFAFAVLSAVFSHPVIRGLGVVVVDADRSETSRAFVEQVAAAPGLSMVERADDLASAAQAIRSGDAIAAVLPIGPFATWQAERAVGDHDRNTLRLRLDPQADAAGFEPGMTVWLKR